MKTLIYPNGDVSFIFKVNDYKLASTRGSIKLNEQIQKVCSRISKNKKLENLSVDVGTVNDDFAKNKFTLKITGRNK